MRIIGEKKMGKHADRTVIRILCPRAVAIKA